MELTLNNISNIKLLDMVEKFKFANIENLLMKSLCEDSKLKPIDYIGEYNKTDVML